MRRQADGAAGAVPGANPASGRRESRRRRTGRAGPGRWQGLAVPGPADGGLAGSAAPGSPSAGQNWPGAGVSQPPFPPAPRPATEPSLPDAGQPERGPFPRAIKPPTDPGAAGTAAWGAGTIGARPSGGGPAAPALPQRPGRERPRSGEGGPPGTWVPRSPRQSGPAQRSPARGRSEARRPRKAVRGQRPACRPGRSPTPSSPCRPPGPPPRRPPAGRWPTSRATRAARARGAAADSRREPSSPRGVSMGGGGPADNTENFPAVGPGTDQRSFSRSNPGDSTESFPAMRPRTDLEDAFRLFPPVRGTDNRPPTDDQD